MTHVQPIDSDELALYALQLLSPAEMEVLSRQLKNDTEARDRLAELFSGMAVLAASAEDVDPSHSSRERLLKQLARERKVVSIDRAPFAVPPSADPVPATRGMVSQHPPRRMAGRVLPWLGWAVAAGVAAGAGVLVQRNHDLEHSVGEQKLQLAKTMTADQFSRLLLDSLKDPSAQNVVLTPGTEKLPPQGRATYNPTKGSLIFLASNLNPIELGKTYELWLLPADGGSPIAAGTFRPDARGNASVILPNIPRGTSAKGFGVTVESGGGSASPTMPILLKGSVA